jgi:hypothetical protein
MFASVKSSVKSVSYREWKEQNKPKKPPILAIGTTAGTGGVRIYDHILYPQKVNKVKKSSPKPKPLHRDVGVQTEPQHDIIMYTSRSKAPPFMSWRLSGGVSDTDSDDEPYFQVTHPNSD